MASEARISFGNRVRSIRQEKEITQESLAELLDKSVEHVSFIERGERSLLRSSDRREPPLRLSAAVR